VPCAALAAVAGCSWDNVEELSAAASHKKAAYQDDKVASDPLEAFCDDNPDADECRWVRLAWLPVLCTAKIQNLRQASPSRYPKLVNRNAELLDAYS
jgi:hypothetical protein